MADLTRPDLGITVEDVRKMREDTGMGMLDCKRELMINALRKGITEAKGFEDLRHAMLRLVDLQ